MPLSWTLQVIGKQSGAIGSFAIDRGVLQFQNLATDTLQFSRAARFDGPRIADYGDVCILTDPGGKRRLYGRRLKSPGIASSSGHNQDYVIGGVWDWLERRTFHQSYTYKSVVDGSLQTAVQLVPKVILNVGSSNEELTIGAQIRRVLEYAILHGAPIAIGDIDVDTVLRASEVVAATCAQVIRNQLVYASDASFWVDYTTLPLPTVHCVRRGNLGSVTLSMVDSRTMAAGYSIEVISPLTAVENEVCPCVALHYEITDTHDGESYVRRVADIAPVGATGLEEDTITDVIGLQGVTTTSISAQLAIEALPVTDPEKAAFAQRLFPWLARPEASEFSVIDISYDGQPASLFDNWITEGTPADWMDLEWEEQLVTIRVAYDWSQAPVQPGGPSGPKMMTELDQPLQARIRVTSALTSYLETDGLRTYSTLTSSSEGDPIPTNMAAAVLASLNTLEWEGAIQITEAQSTDLVRMGLMLNLAGSADPRHAAMNALIKSISVDIGTRKTTATIGPGGRLSLDRRLEIIRSNYLRKRWTSVTQQQTGEPAGNGVLALGRQAGSGHDLTNAPHNPSYLAVRSGTKSIVADAESPSHAVADGANNSTTTPGREVHVAGTGTVDVNAADCPGATAKLRLTNICVLVGSTPTTFPVKLLRTAIPGES